MKKVIALVAALAVTSASFGAFAQKAQEEDVLFKHLSVGVGIGLLDGLQVQVATTLLPNLQGRILYTDFFMYPAIANGIVKNSAGFGINPLNYTTTVKVNQNGFNFDQVTLAGSIQQRNLSLLVDFFPSAKSSFHVTGGLMFNLSPALVSLTAGTWNTTTNTDGLNDIAAAGNAELYGITVNPSDRKGHLDIRYAWNVVKPYVGIGFGRPCSTKHRVGVNFDMGIAFTGGIHAYSYSYYDDKSNPKKVELNEAWLDWVAKENPEDADLQKSIADIKASGELKYLQFANDFPIMPYLRLTVNVAIF